MSGSCYNLIAQKMVVPAFKLGFLEVSDNITTF
jgi:hypothetical protein